jgi:hypothetical protein
MSDLSAFEGEFNTLERFNAETVGLAQAWTELGLDPDAFLKCTVCHGWLFDPLDHFNPVPHPSCIRMLPPRWEWPL